MSFLVLSFLVLQNISAIEAGLREQSRQSTIAIYIYIFIIN